MSRRSSSFYRGNRCSGGCRLGRTHGQIVDCVAVAVCRRRGSRSEAAKDGVAGTAPVRWGWRSWSGSGEAQDGVVELARVRMARPRLQLLAVEGVAVAVVLDDDVGVPAPA